MKLSQLREKILLKTGGIGDEWDYFVIITFVYFEILPANSIENDFDLPIDFLKLF